MVVMVEGLFDVLVLVCCSLGNLESVWVSLEFIEQHSIVIIDYLDTLDILNSFLGV